MARVCHMTSVHTRYDVRIFQKECTSLAKAGFEVYLVVSDGKEDEVKDQVHILTTAYQSKHRIARMIRSARKVYKKALAVEADIYHFHDPELLPYGYLLKKKGKKVIFDSHENLFMQIQEKEYIPALARKLLAKLFVAFLSFVCKKMDAVISVDPQICKRYRRINKNTVRVANFPIFEETSHHAASGGLPKIAFAGGVDPQWNHAAIIKAMGKVKEKITYTVCGRAEEGYLAQLKKLPCWKQVSFRGVVPHEEAWKVLCDSDIGVALCSYSSNTNQKRGTIGNTKLFEIMMAGIPVICTRFELWEKIVENYGCGICIEDPCDSEEIAAGIQYLLSDKQRAGKMGMQGQKAVREKYHWEAEEKKLLALYARLSDMGS